MSKGRFGTFEGVFTPTFLSILGVIMYLRLGWVVGHTGLKGALLIITIANLITLFTGLSIASVATNMRVGTGGAYAMISKSLGLEIGGAIGLPLYLSQAISVAFYITGFTECWISVFPGHDFLYVSLFTWVILLTIAYTSAKLAFRLQYGIMAVILLSLVSIFLGRGTLAPTGIAWEGLGDLKFWHVFAVFFPAVTGILAGVSMSGELKKPERSLPLGTLVAIGISFVIYMLLAVWFAYNVSPQALASNTSVILEVSRWRFIVVAGIMGATISSALSMFVASARTLLALGKHGIIPFASSFSRTTKGGEPTPAIMLTAVISIAAIALGTLNTIAGLLTMFFLITYGMLNASVFIEQTMGIASFRPGFKVHSLFPLLGGAGCFLAMFLINPVFGAGAIIATIAIYFILLRQEIQRSWPDVRKGFAIFIAEQAAKISLNLPYHPKIWKPNLLIPVEDPKDWADLVEFIRTITYPRGRVELFSIREKSLLSRVKLEEQLSLLSTPLKEDGILVSAIVIDSDDFPKGADIVMQTLKETVLPPNVLFIKLGPTSGKDPVIKKLIKKADAHELGAMVFKLHPKIGLSQKNAINLWVRGQSPNIDLAVLVALQLKKNWNAQLRLLQIVNQNSEKEKAQSYLAKLKKLMRMPADTEIYVAAGRFEKTIAKAPVGDINIFGMSEDLDIHWMRDVSEKINTSVLFLKDSKYESAIV